MNEPRSLNDYRDPGTVEQWEAQAAEMLSRLPVIVEVVPLVEWFQERDQAVTVAEWETAGARVGRNQSPQLADLLRVAGLLNGEVLAYAVADAWSAAEMPLHCLSHETWRELFAEAGYTVNGVRAAGPTDPVKLYRGARHEHRRRWSWTSDPILAHWFADRPQVAGVVYEMVAPPESVLAAFTPDGQAFRSESEIVVDTTGLRITEHLCSCDFPPPP